jgi:poly(hydroxyalkanoate) depolymerase family esterase
VSAVRRAQLPAQLWVIVAVAISMLVACSGAHTRTKPPRTNAPESVPQPAARVAPSVTTPPGTTSVAVLMSNGVERSYRLHAPPPVPPAGPAPLVIVLHGATGNAARVELRYHWDGLADRAGFFVVYPQGLLDQWNATLDPRAADDVRFLSALIDRLAQTLPVDSGRVYVAGMSNGGSMTYRLGCALADRIAAIAAVEAASSGCRSGRVPAIRSPPGPASSPTMSGRRAQQAPPSSCTQSATVATSGQDRRLPCPVTIRRARPWTRPRRSGSSSASTTCRRASERRPVVQHVVDLVVRGSQLNATSLFQRRLSMAFAGFQVGG